MCWSSCDVAACSERRKGGVLRDRGSFQGERTQPDASRITRVLNIWFEAQRMDGTIVESYLRVRGIVFNP